MRPATYSFQTFNLENRQSSSFTRTIIRNVGRVIHSLGLVLLNDPSQPVSPLAFTEAELRQATTSGLRGGFSHRNNRGVFSFELIR